MDSSFRIRRLFLWLLEKTFSSGPSQRLRGQSATRRSRPLPIGTRTAEDWYVRAPCASQADPLFARSQTGKPLILNPNLPMLPVPCGSQATPVDLSLSGESLRAGRDSPFDILPMLARRSKN